MRALAGMILATALVIGMMGCGGGAPSCEQALGHYYDIGCYLAAPGTGQPMGRDDAIKSCTDNKAQCGACASAIDDAMSCLNGLVKGECSLTMCLKQIQAYSSCVTDASKCGGGS